MAIAWGSIGTLWKRKSRKDMVPVCNVYVRPSRYTYTKMEDIDYFTVSFMDNSHRRSIAYLGAKSGHNDPAKITSAGLELEYDGDTAYMKNSELVLICKKIYHQALQRENFIDECLIAYNYKDENNAIHEMFVGEIIKVLVKE